MSDDRKEAFLKTGIQDFRVAQVMLTLDAGDLVRNIDNERSFLLMNNTEYKVTGTDSGVRRKILNKYSDAFKYVIQEMINILPEERYNFSTVDKVLKITAAENVTAEDIYDDFSAAFNKIRKAMAISPIGGHK